MILTKNDMKGHNFDTNNFWVNNDIFLKFIQNQVLPETSDSHFLTSNIYVHTQIFYECLEKGFWTYGWTYISESMTNLQSLWIQKI